MLHIIGEEEWSDLSVTSLLDPPLLSSEKKLSIKRQSYNNRSIHRIFTTFYNIRGIGGVFLPLGDIKMGLLPDEIQ